MANNHRSYLQVGSQPDPNTHVITTLYVESLIPLTDAADAIAAESSIGTWTSVSGMSDEIFDELGAKVFYLNEISKIIKIAYPIALFETDNIPQLFADVAGNIYGLKEIKKLRLIDVELPHAFLAANPGPSFGVEGYREHTGVSERPFLGTIIKPKVGLSPDCHAKTAYEAWLGGVDLVKDDENLTDQAFNPFKERVVKTLELKYQAEGKTGEKKIYAANISGRIEEMLERAEFIKERGGHCLMIDIVTVGFAGVQYIRRKMPDMIVHGHRAMHGAFDHDPDHGISMLVIAKIARLAGIDSLHTGTVIGKMHGGRQEVTSIDTFLRSDWGALRTTLPVASGGLHPGHVPELINILGSDVLMNMGGGIHGHPDGSRAGATAARQAIEAAMQKIPLKEYAKKHTELKDAVDKWGVFGDETFSRPMTAISRYIEK